jgi:hypothetical protein
MPLFSNSDEPSAHGGAERGTNPQQAETIAATSGTVGAARRAE